MVENVSNNMSKVKNIEVQPIMTCSYKKKECNYLASLYLHSRTQACHTIFNTLFQCYASMSAFNVTLYCHASVTLFHDMLQWLSQMSCFNVMPSYIPKCLLSNFLTLDSLFCKGLMNFHFFYGKLG